MVGSVDAGGRSQPAAVRVVRNDWGPLVPPALDRWRPTQSVSVIIPAYNCQSCLEIVLAALRHQTYPSELLEVVVVDDGSEPALRLPAHAPDNCRLVRAPEHASGWGRATARHVGVSVSDGEILHWLDADLVPFPQHVAAQARWHATAPDVVTLGYQRFVAAERLGDLSRLRDRVATGAVGDLFPADAAEPHEYVEEFIAATDRLRRAGHLAFRAYAGATAALRRDLYRAAGGLDTRLRLGEDAELGYRLAQAGAVFIPEPRAESWHLGASHSMRGGERQRRYHRPYLADRMPQPQWLRGGVRRSWAVPLVTAVVEVDGCPLELVRACVDRLLDSDDPDLQIRLVGEWGGEPPDDRRRLLDDPLQDRRLIAATYRSEPRVKLVDRAPSTGFPSPYLLRVPVYLGVAPGTVRRLVREADAWQLGLLRLLPPGTGADASRAPHLGGDTPDLSGDPPDLSGDTPATIELWRTAAVSRARRWGGGSPESTGASWENGGGRAETAYDEALARAVASVWGAQWCGGDEYGVVGLLAPPAVEPPPARTGEPVTGLPSAPAPVPVAGLRSLARATRYVGELAATRAWRQLAIRRGRA